MDKKGIVEQFGEVTPNSEVDIAFVEDVTSIQIEDCFEG